MGPDGKLNVDPLIGPDPRKLREGFENAINDMTNRVDWEKTVELNAETIKNVTTTVGPATAPKVTTLSGGTKDSTITSSVDWEATTELNAVTAKNITTTVGPATAPKATTLKGFTTANINDLVGEV